MLVIAIVGGLLVAGAAGYHGSRPTEARAPSAKWCHRHPNGKACRRNAAPPPASAGTTTTSSTNPTPSVPSSSGQFLPPAPTGKVWANTFAEDFNGPGHKMATSADWNNGQGTYSFNAGREWYDPCQVVVSGGTAKLQAAPVTAANCTNPNHTAPPGSGAHAGYLSGYVGTNRKLNRAGEPYVFAYTYGYAEARMKLPPQTPGFFSAFWTLDASCVDTVCQSFDYNNEIDIVEVLGNDASTIWQTSHTTPDRKVTYSVDWLNGADGDTNGECPRLRYDNAFHTYGMDWEPTFIAFYIDGKKCGQVSNGYTNPNPAEPQNTFVSPSTPQYLIINEFVDHGWETSWGSHVTPTNGVWPSRTLEVDYLRVFQQRG